MTRRTDSKAPLRWLVLCAGAAALVSALLFSSQIYFSMIDHGHDWWRLFAWQLTCWGFWAAVSPWVLRAGARFLRPAGRPPLWWLRFALLAAVTVAGQIMAGTVALWLLQPYVPIATYSLAASLSRMVNAWLTVAPILFAILVAMGYGWSGFWSARRRELRESRLQGQLARAELDALRLEIQPHFLFNTLNSIAAQVRKGDGSQALEMILGLSALLRSTLEHDGAPLVPLDEEVAFVERYLDLQKARFGDRLDSHFDIPADCARASVPFLLLQPLVENAIGHGLATRARGGTIDIRVARAGDRLRIAVLDDGVGLPADFSLDTHAGRGLGNTRSKLSQIYPEEGAELEVEEREGGGTAVLVTLPLQWIGEEAGSVNAAA